jgi:hypothetical protein
MHTVKIMNANPLRIAREDGDKRRVSTIDALLRRANIADALPGQTFYLVSPVLGLSMMARKYYEISDWLTLSHRVEVGVRDLVAENPYGDVFGFSHDQDFLIFTDHLDALDAVRALHDLPNSEQATYRFSGFNS